MVELLKFVLSNPWNLLGTLFLIVFLCFMVTVVVNVIMAEKRKSKIISSMPNVNDMAKWFSSQNIKKSETDKNKH